MNNLVIGKRIPIGGIVGGICSAGFWAYNAANPENPIPAEVAGGLTTAVIGMVQLFVVNAFGVTTE